MRTFLLLVCCVISAIVAHAQSTQTIICETPANDAFANVCIEMPEYREIWSGTKIIVTYDESVPQEMVGAFDYAAKLWEEQMPVTIPITIKVKVESIGGSRSSLSNVNMSARQFLSNMLTEWSLPVTAVKSICLQDYNYNGRRAIIDKDQDLIGLKNSYDIEITYNKNNLNDFSFNLDEEVISDKYDFVTLALRDIALGLGYSHNIRCNLLTKKIVYPTGRNLTPFETAIKKALNGNDSITEYEKAISDDLYVYGHKIYAPNPFDNSKSLKFFDPTGHDVNCIYCRLLSYDFSKGYVMRDLTMRQESVGGVVYNGWNSLFETDFKWIHGLYTGYGDNGEISEESNDDNILPFKGSYTFDSPQGIFASSNSNGINMGIPVNNTEVYKKLEVGEDEEELWALDPEPYSLRYPPIRSSLSPYYVISAQLKDGTWDNLVTPLSFGLPYIPGYMYDSVTIDMESLTHNHPIEDYARTVSGGLKYRLIKRSGDQADRKFYYVKYFTRSYTPQNAVIKYSKVHEENSPMFMQRQGMDSDEYFIDVEIGISNLEGTRKVEVEQFDGDSQVPFYYYVEDFRKGYFIANLDRELETTLVVISYNENGTSRSNIIVIPPMGYPEDNVSFTLNRESISIDGLRERSINNNEIRYVISTPLNPVSTQEGIIGNDRTVDISSLSKGIYVMSILNKGEHISSFKFAK